ncbi:unnamed protein product [Triticum turgidum subsp. durum]|uniref:Reticulon-like protein n=1 Tax=Triticum turgidum subsp. durum TaxID=4567 RepID=A0A9R1QD85_TRITD|nr:unnamed protein product [Triticum turgidum subsp. durum]
MQQPGAATPSTRRRLTVPRRSPAAASVWETRMEMDEVKGGVKVFSEGADDADEEGMRVYSRLRRNQSDGGGAGAGAGTAAAAKKRRNWKASEPVTAIGELRKSRSDAASTGAVAKRAVARVTTPEKKLAAEVKEVVVVEVEQAPLPQPKNIEEEAEEEEEEEWEEELEAEEEEKEVLDQDQTAIDEDETDQATAPNQADEQDLAPPTKRAIRPVAAPIEDERALNPEPTKLAAAVNLRAMNPEPMTPASEEETDSGGNSQDGPRAGKNFSREESFAGNPPPFPEARACRRYSPEEEEEYEEIQGRPSALSASNRRMQNIVDLVMWRDVSKSAFVFGFGTFSLISCSYAKDLNFNTITAASYLGLVYLGLRFLCKSLLNRGESVECDDETNNGRSHYLVGEEDAVWLLRLVLPYVNEVLLNLRSLFSGEPATTMKLALLLFAMARCGNFVTLWTLAKLVFFGIFTIPKVCSSYSTQLARYGKFWLERFRDAWESCSHKKAVVAAVFTLVWNVSSTVARVWAVFMLVVAMKCYQQRLMEFGWSSSVEEAAENDEPQQQQEESPAKPVQTEKAHDQGSHGFVAARHRRMPVSGEFARERLRARGGIQPRC